MYDYNEKDGDGDSGVAAIHSHSLIPESPFLPNRLFREMIRTQSFVSLGPSPTLLGHLSKQISHVELNEDIP